MKSKRLKDLGAKQADVEKIREDVKKQSDLAEAEAAEATRTNDIAQAEVCLLYTSPSPRDRG